MAEEQKPAEAAPPAKSSNLPIILIGAMNFLATAGLGAFVFLKVGTPPPPVVMNPDGTIVGADAGVAMPEEPKINGRKPGIMVKLDDIVIQLRNPEFDRYARMSFDVELRNDSAKDNYERVKPEIRDSFISYLSDRTYEEMRGSQGLNRIKVELFNRIKNILPEDDVKALYVTNFVVQ